MFFIGIFGIDKKNDEVKALHDTECRECSSHSTTLYKEYYRFHFFFIPIITWGRKYKVVCNSCGTLYNVDEEKDSYSYRDLNNIQFRGNNGFRTSGHHNMKCSFCGEAVSDSWIYCPSCGGKL